MLETECSLRSGHNIIIREAVASDAAAAVCYFQRVSCESDFLDFTADEFTITEAEESLFFEACLVSDHQLYLLALLEGDIMGAMHFRAGTRERSRHVGEISMSVSKKLWGHGVGSMLLDCLLNWVEKKQFIKKISLAVRADNERALRLYQRKGFIVEGILLRERCINLKYYDVVCMTKFVNELL